MPVTVVTVILLAQQLLKVVEVLARIRALAVHTPAMAVEMAAQPLRERVAAVLVVIRVMAVQAPHTQMRVLPVAVAAVAAAAVAESIQGLAIHKFFIGQATVAGLEYLVAVQMEPEVLPVLREVLGLLVVMVVAALSPLALAHTAAVVVKEQKITMPVPDAVFARTTFITTVELVEEGLSELFGQEKPE